MKDIPKDEVFRLTHLNGFDSTCVDGEAEREAIAVFRPDLSIARAQIKRNQEDRSSW
jgi:hypothetical protein